MTELECSEKVAQPRSKPLFDEMTNYASNELMFPDQSTKVDLVPVGLPACTQTKVYRFGKDLAFLTGAPMDSDRKRELVSAAESHGNQTQTVETAQNMWTNKLRVRYTEAAPLRCCCQLN